MSQVTNPLNIHNNVSPLVEKLGRHADFNRDGKISGPEFAEFLDQVLHPQAPSTPALKVPAPYGDRLVGLDVRPSASPSAPIKERLAAIAQYLSPSPEHLRQIARELGPAAGVVSPDGLSLMLSGGQGVFGVRDRANGPVWQWMAHDLALPKSGGF
jgi:hypothetical protein